MNSEIPKPKRIRRSQMAKELHAVELVIEAIRPFDAEQRKKVMTTALTMPGDEP